MKTKTISLIALVLALLLIAPLSMWAQKLTATPVVPTNVTQSSDGVAGGGHGDHISHGCMLCHTPHLTGTTQQPLATGLTQAQLGSAYVTGTTMPAGGAQSAGANMPNGGGIYLWGQALSPLTYTTWDGHALPASSGVTINSPAIHSIMCLSCHDGAVGGGTHDLGGTLGGPGGTVPEPSFNPGGLNGVAFSQYNNGAGPGGWMQASSLLTTHPIDVIYVSGSTQPATQVTNWNVTVAGNTVTWNDATFVPYTGGGAYPGHPARLYGDGTNAWVECTSCHEPHRLNHVAYQNGAGWVVDTAVGATAPTTAYYIRGPFNVASAPAPNNAVANGEQNAGFCRSCHFDKSADYWNSAGVPR